jgi:hypothetical protein
LNLFPYKTIVRATSGEPEAVDEVFTTLQQANPNRFHFLKNGYIIKQRQIVKERIERA